MEESDRIALPHPQFSQSTIKSFSVWVHRELRGRDDSNIKRKKRKTHPLPLQLPKGFNTMERIILAGLTVLTLTITAASPASAISLRARDAHRMHNDLKAFTPALTTEANLTQRFKDARDANLNNKLNPRFKDARETNLNKLNPRFKVARDRNMYN